MSSKAVLRVVGLLIVFGALYYFASAFVSLRTIANAVRSGDRDVLALKVDFPSVRDSMKSQFNAVLARSMTSDPSLKNNPFAGFAAMLVPVMVDRIVDSYVTPDGIATLLRQQIKEASPENRNSGKPALWNGSFSYIDVDHFKATYSSADHPDQPFGVVLERVGLFNWKLMRLDLPLDAIEQAASKGRGAPQPNAR